MEALPTSLAGGQFPLAGLLGLGAQAVVPLRSVPPRLQRQIAPPFPCLLHWEKKRKACNECSNKQCYRKSGNFHVNENLVGNVCSDGEPEGDAVMRCQG